MDTVDPVDYPLCSVCPRQPHSSFRNDHCASTDPAAPSLPPSLRFDKKKPRMVGVGQRYLGDLQGSERICRGEVGERGRVCGSNCRVDH